LSDAKKQRRRAAASRAAEQIQKTFKALAANQELLMRDVHALNERLAAIEQNHEQLVAMLFPPEMVERARAEQEREDENGRDTEGPERVR